MATATKASKPNSGSSVQCSEIVPTASTKARNTIACTQAIADPPSTLPANTGQRPTGATNTDCMKPSRRSSITEMVAKMAVNNTINATVPGKKNCKKSCPPAPSKEPRKPVPNSTQNSSGWTIAATTRFRWRKKRTHSRLANIQAAANPLGVAKGEPTVIEGEAASLSEPAAEAEVVCAEVVFAEVVIDIVCLFVLCVGGSPKPVPRFGDKNILQTGASDRNRSCRSAEVLG